MQCLLERVDLVRAPTRKNTGGVLGKRLAFRVDERLLRQPAGGMTPFLKMKQPQKRRSPVATTAKAVRALS